MPPSTCAAHGVTSVARLWHDGGVPQSAAASTAPVELDEPITESVVSPETPWVTVVWNDPVNLMTYVAFVFQEYFGYDKAKAERLMLQVHEEGRSAVSNGSREEMERDVAAMHGYGLWATMQQDK